MNRIIGTLCLAAMVTVSVSSCKKTDEQSQSFVISLPEVKGLDMGQDRAYIDAFDGQVMRWNEGDQVRVYNIDNDNYANSETKVYTAVEGSEGLTTTTFRGLPLGELKDGLFFFFPAAKASGNLLPGNRETFYVPEVQTYNEGTTPGNRPVVFDPQSLVMAIDMTNNTDYMMDHIFGFLNVRVETDEPIWVQNIVVEDNAFNLTGQMSLKIPAVNTTKFTDLMDYLDDGNQDDAYAAALEEYLSPDFLGYESQPTGKIITMDCSNADGGLGVECATTGKTYFFIGVRPGAFDRGFKVTVNYLDEDDNEGSQVFTVDPDPTKPHGLYVKPGTFTNITCHVNP